MHYIKKIKCLNAADAYIMKEPKCFILHTRQCVENFGAKNLREVDRMIQNGTITEDDLK